MAACKEADVHPKPTRKSIFPVWACFGVYLGVLLLASAFLFPPLVQPGYQPLSASAFTEVGDGRININTASAEELMLLPGIGETRAHAIIEYRQNNGAFSSIEDLKNVNGIGEQTLAGVADNIRM